MNLAPSLLLTLALLTLVGSAQDQAVPFPELDTLKTEYDTRVTASDGLHLAAVADLDKKYLARLEQEQKIAQKAGNLDEAVAINGEKMAISTGGGVPVEDDVKTTAVLKKMHALYRAEKAKLALARDSSLKPLRDDYIKKLDVLVTELTKAGKLQEAMTVKTFRQSLPALSAVTSKNSSAGATPRAPKTPVATKGAVPWITPELPQPNSSGWITLFDGKRLAGCDPSAEAVASGKILLDDDGVLRLDNKYISFNVAQQDAVLRVQVQKVSGQNVTLNLRGYSAYFNGGKVFGIGKGNPFKNLKGGSSSKDFDDFFDMEFTVDGGKITLKANGRTTVALEDQDKSIKKGGVSVGALNGVSLFRRIEVKILDDRK